MHFVLDASVVLAWLLPDEANAVADAIVERLAERAAVVPAIWPLEIANVLLLAERRARIRPLELERLLQAVFSLPVTVEPAADAAGLGRVLSIARAHGLSAYDAAYLELAKRRALPIATLDQRLGAAAAGLGLHVVG